MTLKSLFLLTLFICLMTAGLHAAEVKNSNVRQQGNRIVFEFDVEGDQGEDTEVNLTLTIKGKTYSADQLHLEGDFSKTKAGKGKKIYWNVLRDYPRGLSARVEWDLTAGIGKAFKDSITGMEFLPIKGGCFQMGDTTGDGNKDEKPVHEVCVSSFHMAKYEVTVGQFRKFVTDTGYRTDAEKNAGGNKGCYAWTQEDGEFDWRDWANWKNPNKYQSNQDNHPVSCVSWNDAKAFTDWLNKKITPLNPPLSKGGGKGGYRLPTEAEWEYAARGGTQSRNFWGDGKGDACRYANVADKTPTPPNNGSWNNAHDCNDGYAFVAPVGKFKPNDYGLYDIMGNVWEWNEDWYGENYYGSSPKDNPRGPGSGASKVYRGGSWYYIPASVRASTRYSDAPPLRGFHIGFRLVAAPSQ
jgi:formylglycine-generating enzyme required for sulfatase activity